MSICLRCETFCLADVSEIPEGAYVGKALIDDSPGHIIKWPLLVVVANGHITGIFAPEKEEGGYNVKVRYSSNEAIVPLCI